MRCHGAYHGNPYELEISPLRARGLPSSEVVVRAGAVVHRRDQAWVARRLGQHIAMRPDTLEYVLGKLGDLPGREFLRRAYLLELPA